MGAQGRRYLQAALGATILSGCAAAPPPPAPTGPETRVQKFERAFADKATLHAKGTKTCVVRQFQSAYKANKWAEQRGEKALSELASNSIIQVNVSTNGTIALGIRDDEFPGTTTYFSVNGRRYRGPARHWIPVSTDTLEALKREAPVQAVWQKWPYRNEINEEDIIAGFEAAYSECLNHLRR